MGTESRLLTLFELLRQMREGTETDPDTRIAELTRRRDAIDADIARVKAGDLPVLSDTALKDRFSAVPPDGPRAARRFPRGWSTTFASSIARSASASRCGTVPRGALLEEVMGERDAIADSDQGKSFHAFWDFLMSQRRQEELTQLLEDVLALPPVAELSPDPRLRRVHYDWLEAGEVTQRTVARLSQQLRRFLDDKAWLENRRIMDILHGIEAKSLEIRDIPPSGDFMLLEDSAGQRRPAPGTPAVPARWSGPKSPTWFWKREEGDVDAAALFAQVVVGSGGAPAARPPGPCSPAPRSVSKSWWPSVPCARGWRS